MFGGRAFAFVVSIVLGGASASCDEIESHFDAQIECGPECIPWNSPEQVIDFSRTTSHVAQDGNAVSGDGRVIAWPTVGAPVGELNVQALDSGERLFVRYHDDRVKLAHPYLSYDGRFLSVVATPPTYWGVGELWLIDTVNLSARRVADSTGCPSYHRPAVTDDGSVVVYARSISRCPTNGRQPEFRGRLSYAAFVQNLSSQEEQVLLEESFFSFRYPIIFDDLLVYGIRTPNMFDEDAFLQRGFCFSEITESTRCEDIRIMPISNVFEEQGASEPPIARVIREFGETRDILVYSANSAAAIVLCRPNGCGEDRGIYECRVATGQCDLTTYPSLGWIAASVNGQTVVGRHGLENEFRIYTRSGYGSDEWEQIGVPAADQTITLTMGEGEVQ